MSKGNSSRADYLLELDRNYLWHPYASVPNEQPLFAVKSARGVRLHLHSGETLIDGMSSWWSALHGYNHPELNAALQTQLHNMAHVMFGGLTHEPAVALAKTLVDISPPGLQRVFFSDSGSVAVEVALKMALQYWQAKGEKRHRFLTLKNGYHGDTIGAMSVCDPDTGMHHLFSDFLAQNIFVDSPRCKFGEPCSDDDFAAFAAALSHQHRDIAAVILEPIVQGTGGMRFYSADYLRRVRKLCDHYDVLFIADEIATGLGRTGELFACNHAGISPDIMCLGKTLSAAYITLAATLCSEKVARQICMGDAGVFMHGPTYMANPLACAVALKSIELLLASDWKNTIRRIESGLRKGLGELRNHKAVADVRVLGGIGVVELKANVDMKKIQPAFVEQGIWIRPFGKLIYTIPPMIINDDDLATLCSGTDHVVRNNIE